MNFADVLKECVKKTYTECSFIANLKKCVRNTHTECSFCRCSQGMLEKNVH